MPKRLCGGTGSADVKEGDGRTYRDFGEDLRLGYFASRWIVPDVAGVDDKDGVLVVLLHALQSSP
jgi:hypothetical protein